MLLVGELRVGSLPLLEIRVPCLEETWPHVHCWRCDAGSGEGVHIGRWDFDHSVESAFEGLGCIEAWAYELENISSQLVSKVGVKIDDTLIATFGE